MLKSKSISLTNAPLLPSIIRYSIPIILGSLIQVLFNSADLAVLGWFDSSPDSVAVSSVGATGAIIGLVVNSVIGLSGGTNILLARAVGAADDKRAARICGTSVVLSLLLGTLTTAVGIVFAPWFLDVTACPEASLAGAHTYLCIYFAASVPIFIYNFGSAIIRVSGDSQRPMVYMIASGALNLVLNFILCFIMTDKVAAVAIATLVSNVLGAALVVIHLLKIEGPCRINIKKLSFSPHELLTIIRTGIPGAFNGALYGIANLQIQSAINSFGTSATAGNSASAQLEGFINSFTNAFGVSALAVVGQNMGAGNKERTEKAIRWCALLSAATALAIGAAMMLFSEPLASIFVPGDYTAVQIAAVRMRHLITIYWMQALNSVLSSTIQAFGYPSLPMMNSIVTVLLFRAIWMTFIYPNMTFIGEPVSDISNVYLCFSVSWTMSLAVCITIFAIVYHRYKRGIIKNL